VIEKFNFYDVYGYLLPGTLLFGLFWLPFGIARTALPKSEISTTLLLLAVAYIFGHILQNIASAVVPSSVTFADGAVRAFSDLVLDKDHPSLGSGIRRVIGTKVQEAFSIDIRADEVGTTESSSNRNNAFFHARAYLIRKKAANYVEQFEGLYAMMRGLACAFFTGCAYLLGWGLSFHWQWHVSCLTMGLAMFVLTVAGIASSVLLSFVSLHFSQAFPTNKAVREARKRSDRGLAASILFVVMGLGYFLGTWHPAPGRVEFFVWTSFSLTPIAGARCLSAYRAFALNFAETVWRNFSELYSPETSKAAEGNPRR